MVDVTVTVIVTSFGYLHGPPPGADIVLNLRGPFRDPHFDPKLRHRTGDDPRVRAAVENTPGIPAVIRALEDMVRAYLAGPSARDVHVAVGCAGGRHRSVAVATALTTRLHSDGITADLDHRDILRPVVTRSGAGER